MLLRLWLYLSEEPVWLLLIGNLLVLGALFLIAGVAGRRTVSPPEGD